MENSKRLKVFDAHIHHSQPVLISDAVKLFEKAFEINGIAGGAFLSLPCHYNENGKGFRNDLLQNIKGLFLKYYFSPNFYAFAGLEHCLDTKDESKLSQYFLNQAKEYLNNGFDGIKMLEGYPQLIKALNIPLDSVVYDAFYSYLEENETPVTMHLANPPENWDANLCDDWAKAHGRFCDETFPTKQELHNQVDRLMKKHPNLRLTLAHFGFLTYNIKDAEHFLEAHPNTMFDITPGGEQFFNLLSDWNVWKKFIEKYRNRIIYGTDLYSVPYTNEVEWTASITSRTNLIRNFFETDAEHVYQRKSYRGVNMDREIIKDIYYRNATTKYGSPKKINFEYLKNKLNNLLECCKELSDEQANDLIFMKNYIFDDKKF